MAYLTEAHLSKRHSVPIALALTLLKQSDWLVLTTIRLSATMRFSFRYLQLQLVEAIVAGVTGTNICDVPPTVLINPSYGLAYVAIYKNYGTNSDPRDLTFVGSSADLVFITAPGVVSRDLALPPLELSESANFTFLLVNNTSNADLRLATNGEVTITL